MLHYIKLKKLCNFRGDFTQAFEVDGKKFWINFNHVRCISFDLNEISRKHIWLIFVSLEKFLNLWIHGKYSTGIKGESANIWNKHEPIKLILPLKIKMKKIVMYCCIVLSCNPCLPKLLLRVTTNEILKLKDIIKF